MKVAGEISSRGDRVGIWGTLRFPRRRSVISLLDGWSEVFSEDGVVKTQP